MQSDAERLDEIRDQLRSPDADTRGRAMQTLLTWTRQDPRMEDAVLPVFRSVLADETDSWTVVSACRGIEFLCGPDVARDAWRGAITRADPVFASRVAAAIEHPSHVPMLLEVLAVREEIPLRAAVIRVLGRSKNPAALIPLLNQLAEPRLRATTIPALGDLGDSRAVSFIEPYRADPTVVDTPDERGWAPRLGDLANESLRVLRAPPATPPLPPPPPPRVPYLQAPWFPVPVGPPPRWTAYLPLMAAVAEIPWLIGGIYLYLVVGGTTHPTPDQLLAMNAYGLMPGLAGLMLAIWVLKRGRPRASADTGFFVGGCVACAGIVFWFGDGFLGG